MTEYDHEADADARALISRADDMPYGEARTLVTERALRAAERDGDHDLVFDVLGELIPTYRYGGEAAKSLYTFVRLVSEFDAGHGEPADWAAHTVRWYYKWAISLLLDYPQFSLERINSVLDEMERRYQEDGQSLHAVYQMRYRVAAHLDDKELADHWYAKWVAAPADENADCAGCNPNSRVGYLTWRRRDEDAIELAGPVLQGHLTCREQPHSMLTSLLMAYVRSGRLDQAVDAHRRAYRVHRGEVSDLGQIGVHVRFCALTGNQPRGLEIVERHLPWVDRFTTPDDAADFASDVALLLGRLPRDTAVNTTGVRIGSELRELADRTEAGELADQLLAWAYEIGARFDERNGNTSYTESIRRTQAREPLLDYLPLMPHSRPRRGTDPSTTTFLGGSADATPLVSTGSTGPAMTSGQVTETDPVALLDLAEEHWWNSRRWQAIACWQRFDEVAPTGEDSTLTVDPLLRGRRAEGFGLQAVEDGDQVAAAEFFQAAKMIFAEVGADVRWWAAEALDAQLLLENGFSEQGTDRLRTAAARLSELGEQRWRRLAELRIARALLTTDRDETRRLLQDLLTADDPALRGRALFLQAQSFAAEGRFSDALSSLNRSLDDARETGSERTYPLLGMRAMLSIDLADAGEVEPSAVRAALDAYVASAVEPHERASVHLSRGRWLLRNDDPEAAMPDLAEAVAELTAIRTSVAECWIDLGEAYLRSERPMDAAEVLEEAVGLVRQEHQAPAQQSESSPEQSERANQPQDPGLTFEMRRARYLLALSKIALGEREDALADLEAVARAEESLGDRLQAGNVAEEWALQLSLVDRDEEAVERFAVAAEHFASAGDLYGEVRCLRRQGLCIFYGPDEEPALAVFERARTLLRERGGELEESVSLAEHAMLDLNQAKTLHYLERSGEAHAYAESAIAGFEKLGADESVSEASMYLRSDDEGPDDESADDERDTDEGPGEAPAAGDSGTQPSA